MCVCMRVYVVVMKGTTDGMASVLDNWKVCCCLSIAIISRFSLTWSGNTF